MSQAKRRLSASEGGSNREGFGFYPLREIEGEEHVQVMHRRREARRRAAEETERLARRSDQSERSSSWCVSLAMIRMSRGSVTGPHGAVARTAAEAEETRGR